MKLVQNFILLLPVALASSLGEEGVHSCAGTITVTLAIYKCNKPLSALCALCASVAQIRGSAGARCEGKRARRHSTVVTYSAFSLPSILPSCGRGRRPAPGGPVFLSQVDHVHPKSQCSGPWYTRVTGQQAVHPPGTGGVHVRLKAGRRAGTHSASRMRHGMRCISLTTACTNVRQRCFDVNVPHVYRPPTLMLALCALLVDGFYLPGVAPRDVSHRLPSRALQTRGGHRIPHLRCSAPLPLAATMLALPRACSGHVPTRAWLPPFGGSTTQVIRSR